MSKDGGKNVFIEAGGDPAPDTCMEGKMEGSDVGRRRCSFMPRFFPIDATGASDFPVWIEKRAEFS